MDMKMGNSGSDKSAPDYEYWATALNDKAQEYGLARSVRAVLPQQDEIRAVGYVYELSDGSLVDLGWSVESAEATLKDMAGASL